MAYEVLARKWRPQQFDDVVGQKHVTETLKNALNSGRVAHAYLFVGPRGVGKTSTARIFAKALNCEKGPTDTPCDKCDSCREIMAGNSMDVLEIDAASNTGVDSVRELRENVQYAPARGPFKIYIIDEVHMLSTAAFNALLKTLEEPPPHVKFVFATTEPQKILATILSRCQRFDLRRIPQREIVGRLAEIAKAEGIKIDEDALLAIARGAEGGLRDAESAMDQLIAFRGKKIKEEDVLSVFGLVARQTLEALVTAVLAGDVPKAIELVFELDESGKDIQRVVVELLEQFRSILVCQYAGEKFVGRDLTEAEVLSVRKQAELATSGRVLRVVDILTEADSRMRYALSRRTLLETALIRGARAATVVSLDEVLVRLERLGSGSVSSAGASPAQIAPEKPREKTSAPQAVRESAPVKKKPEPELKTKPVSPKSPEEEVRLLAEQWHEFVERVGRVAVLARNYLVDAKPVKVVGNVVTIGFDPEFADNKDHIDVGRNRKAIQKVLSEFLHRDGITADFTVLDAKSTLPGDVKVGDTSPGDRAAESIQGSKSMMSRKTKEKWIADPTVRKTLEMFNGDVVDIRE